MSIVTLFSGSYCHADELAQEVARQLGYQSISEEEILKKASEKYGVAEDRLARTLYGPPSFFKGLGEDRAENVAYVRVALAERIAEDDIVYSGFAMHLLPKNISHVLRVCLVAEQNYKVQVAIEKEGISERKAKNSVKSDNKKQLDWVQYLFDLSPWDESLYDMVIPMSGNSLETASALICDNARKQALETTPQSRKAVSDFMTAAQVYLKLAGKWPDVEVSCMDGHVRLLINKYVIRLEHLKKELATVARSVPGVKSAEAGIGPKYRTPSIYRDFDSELPSKILLVDDEREFVQTLSERLLARKMEAAVAYNGEEALSHVAADEPEVMVLDLKMPGIDGMEVLRKVRKERPNVEVIILTGHGSEKDKALAEQLGAFAYLEKPIDIEVLTQTMKEAYKKIREAKADGDNSSTATG